MERPFFVKLGRLFLLGLALFLGGCAGQLPRSMYVARISIHDQTMQIEKDGKPIERFPVSTSKFGVGDEPRSFRTPIGRFVIAQKIGDGVPVGGKFFHRRFTGEVVNIALCQRADYRPRTDSILTRILWLKGLDPTNRNAFRRGIYIHGTNEEGLIGQPSSYGCIRMRNRDVLAVFNMLPVGSEVIIQREPLPSPASTSGEKVLAAVSATGEPVAAAAPKTLRARAISEDGGAQ
jgi:hypothetical protein